MLSDVLVSEGKPVLYTLEVPRLIQSYMRGDLVAYPFRKKISESKIRTLYFRLGNWNLGPLLMAPQMVVTREPGATRLFLLDGISRMEALARRYKGTEGFPYSISTIKVPLMLYAWKDALSVYRNMTLPPLETPPRDAAVVRI